MAPRPRRSHQRAGLQLDYTALLATPMQLGALMSSQEPVRQSAPPQSGFRRSTGAPDAARRESAPGAQPIFAGSGELRERCRELDWAATPLGAPDLWPQSLRTTAGIVLASGFPTILLWGPGRTQLYNDAYIPFLGLKHPAALGMSPEACWPEVWPLVEPLLARVSAGETVTLADQFYPLLRRGPNVPPDNVYVTVTYVPVRDETDGVAGLVVISIDTTAQVDARRLEAEQLSTLRDAETARLRAEAANRAKGDFLAVMSHELRTPLNAIGGYAELIEMGLRGPVTEQQRVDLAHIQESQRYLLGLIGQVLDYTRVENSTIRYDIALVPLADSLAAAEMLVMPQVRARCLTYSPGDARCELVVKADPHKLRQILVNLLTNAVKFTDPGGSIRVRCVRDCDRVTVSITDTGIGIEPDQLERVFEPFVQVEERLTRSREGIGLGLAISRELARGMGGELTVESVVGVGSTFTLVLPGVTAKAESPRR